MIAQADDPQWGRYLELAVARRPTEELYDVRRDPGCIHNLAGESAFEPVRAKLAARLEEYLAATGDRRVVDGGEVWESYPRTVPFESFPNPSSRSSDDASTFSIARSSHAHPMLHSENLPASIGSQRPVVCALSASNRASAAQYYLDLGRRHGLFRSGLLRWGDRHAGARSTRSAGDALQPVLQQCEVYYDSGIAPVGHVSAWQGQ